MQNRERLRVAHVVSGMVAGGIETWLMHVLRHIDQDKIQMDFFVNVEGESFHDDEIRDRGTRIVRCRSARNPVAFARTLVSGLRDHGPYDVVHSHLDHYSGLVLAAASHAGVPMRVAHAHSDTSGKQSEAGLFRKCYLLAAKYAIGRWATHGLANGAAAGSSLFPGWGADQRWQVHHCSIDLEPFRAPLDAGRVRGSLGLAPGGLVLGHVGSFREPKNHRFLIDVMSSVLAGDPDASLLLIGDGQLRAQIEDYVRMRGIADRVKFLGLVPDVAPYLYACDVLVLPSLWEGVPLAAVEGQAAGLPCVVATTITPAVAIVDDMVVFVPLTVSPETWASAIFEAATMEHRVSREVALAAVESSSFNIRTAIPVLEDFYLSGVTVGERRSE